MFDSERSSADVTLCIFPHLKEFVAIDARKERPDGPAILNLSISNILRDDFFNQVEQDFSKLIRRHELGFMELMGIPQQVEAVVRANSLKRIIAELGITPPENPEEPASSVGVLFFAGSLLALEEGQFREAIQELFGNKLGPQALEQLKDQLLQLIERERQNVADTAKQDLAGLISGKSSQYVTIWESSGN